MNCSLLRSEINQIQREYKDLLSNLLPILRGKRSLEALDEINLFWLKNIDVVKLYLKSEFKGTDSYVFTAATYLDIEDKEHYPFLLLGTQHVLDDPLCKYAEICSKMSDGRNAEFTYKQIIKAAEDDIKIISTCEEQIIVLPLRLLNRPKEGNPLISLGEQIFLSLFPKVDSIESYFHKCSTISDIIQYGIPNLAEVIMFSEDDNRTAPLEERFRKAVDEMPYMLDKEKSDAENFFMLVYGHLHQALDVIVSCEEYQCIPYIRYPVAINYISLIANNILHLEYIQEMCFKMSIAFIIYNLCDKDLLSQAGLKTFLVCRDRSSFGKRLYSTMEAHGINHKTFLRHPVSEFVNTALVELYTSINEAGKAGMA